MLFGTLSVKERVNKMVEQDTIKLLRECDAGIKMGVSSINDVLEYVDSNSLKDILIENRNAHEKINDDLKLLLEKYQDDGKSPNPIAKGMSWMKTNVSLTVNDSDKTIAELITDGCNMGVKSLNKYLNQYEAADEKSKNLTKSIIKLEKDLILKMEKYL